MKHWFYMVGLCVALSACSRQPKAQWLMPTPKVYQDGAVDPFQHLAEADRSIEMDVFYATNRSVKEGSYGNGISEELSLGVARVALGEEGDDWKRLREASTVHPRSKPMPVRLVDVQEQAFGWDGTESAEWVKALDKSLERTETRDVMIYVHGAKVGFEHSCAFAAELDHFSGRDFTAVAFDWSTHRELFSYVDGVDVRHGVQSAGMLADLIRRLADGTSAERIHIVSWSAGARVVSRAMVELAGADAGAARKRFRLGTLVFAAADVPEKAFIERAPAVHGVCDRVLVYVSDDDFALRWSSRLMGGGRRLGMEPHELSGEEQQMLDQMPRLEVVDASYGKKLRGFDIGGHRYWFQHPWVNSDVILAVRTGAAAEERGLTRGRVESLYYFGPEYGEEIGGVARDLTKGKW